MATVEGDLSDFDIHRIMEALSTRQSTVVASCALSIKILLTEIQQQLLDLMVQGNATDAPASHSSEDAADEDFMFHNSNSLDFAFKMDESLNDEAIGDDDEDEDDMSVTQEVVTGATVPITGSLIKSPNPYPCPHCQELFSTKKALSRHVIRHNQETEDSADPLETSQSVEAEDGTAGQESTDTSKPKDEENNGTESERKPIKLKLSLSKSPGVKLVCEECGTQTLKQHMARHMLTHTGVKPFACEVCHVAFARKDKLKEHMKKHDDAHYKPPQPAKPKKDDKPKVLKCRKCDFSTEDKYQLKEHRKTHPTKMLYKCEDCDKEFHCPSHLEQHNIKHRNEKPYMCDKCGVSFSREPNLARHIRSHTNPAPFHCKFCNKPYHRNNEMIVHERTHTGEKPYICEICGNGYASSKYLKRHLFTHTGLKPFKCDLCDRAFARPENMRAHRKLHEKSTNRLPPPTDAVASAFHASQMDSVVDGQAEELETTREHDMSSADVNSTHGSDMYQFPPASSISPTASNEHASGDSPANHMMAQFKLAHDF